MTEKEKGHQRKHAAFIRKQITSNEFGDVGGILMKGSEVRDHFLIEFPRKLNDPHVIPSQVSFRPIIDVQQVRRGNTVPMHFGCLAGKIKRVIRIRFFRGGKKAPERKLAKDLGDHSEIGFDGKPL